jgi:hypothetical protein
MAKTIWQFITTFAKKILRINSTDVSPTCLQITQNSVNSKDITLNSGSSTAVSLVNRPPDLPPILSENYIQSSNNHSDGTDFYSQEKTVTTTEPVTKFSFTPTGGDRNRTLMRYIAAVEHLKAALKLRQPGWETFEFPEFDVIPESNGSLALLRTAIDEKLDSYQELRDVSVWQKGKTLVERLFVASSPFVKNILTAVRGASQSVNDRPHIFAHIPVVGHC